MERQGSSARSFRLDEFFSTHLDEDDIYRVAAARLVGAEIQKAVSAATKGKTVEWDELDVAFTDSGQVTVGLRGRKIAIIDPPQIREFGDTRRIYIDVHHYY